MDLETSPGPERRGPRRRRHHPDHPERRGGRRGGRGGHGRRGHAARGDVRAAVLQLLAQQPMHGYQLIQTVTERTAGRWTPSPGAIYPTISQLEDEGLATVTAESGRKLVTLTEQGRDYVESTMAGVDPFAEFDPAEPGPDLRPHLDDLHAAARQVARTGTEAQRTAAVDVLIQARRSLYLLLADDTRNSES